MAFQDFITSGSYSIINKVQYDHQNKVINYIILVFTDDTKEEVIATMEKIHDGKTVFSSIVDKEVNTPPTNPENGDCYIVGPSPTGDWASFPGSYAIWYGGRWDLKSSIPNTFYNIQDEKYYKKRDDTYIEIKDVFTQDTWNTYFSIEELNTVDNNLIKAIYTYLKSRTEFTGVTDC